MAVEAAAGAGAAGEEFATEKARWYLPEGMIRHEGDAEPGNLRVLRARGDSMEPLVSDGDRLLVDVTRRAPGTGETAVLWDGTGLVVKRVEVLPNAEPPRRIRFLQIWRKSKTGQIICYIDRSYRVLATQLKRADLSSNGVWLDFFRRRRP